MKWNQLSRWFRGASSEGVRPTTPTAASTALPPFHGNGCPLLLRRLDRDQAAAPILDGLAQRYELVSMGDESRTFRVIVDDAQDPDEAVVRLVVALDELDPRWERSFAWPRSE